MKTMMKRKFHYCRPQTKLQEGNVSTPVCHSVHMGGSVPACITKGSLSSGGLCLGGLSRGVSVQRVSVQGISVQQVSVQGGLCTWGLCPGRSLYMGSLSRGSLSRGVSVQGVSVQGGLCPWGLCSGGLCPGGLCPAGLCPGRVSFMENTPERDPPPSGNDWAVHILLECILVICSIRVGTKNDTLIRGKQKTAKYVSSNKRKF